MSHDSGSDDGHEQADDDVDGHEEAQVEVQGVSADDVLEASGDALSPEEDEDAETKLKRTRQERAEERHKNATQGPRVALAEFKPLTRQQMEIIKQAATEEDEKEGEGQKHLNLLCCWILARKENDPELREFVKQRFADM